MVSKAVPFAVTITLGLLVPGPTVLPSVWVDGLAMQSAALLEVERGARAGCSPPGQEIRFEMLPRDAQAAPPPRQQSVCLAVYRTSEDAAQP